MQQLRLNENTAGLRRIPLPQCVQDADGIGPQTGLSFSAAEIKLSKNGAAEASSAGTVGEIGSGYYYYIATAAELDTEGFLLVRLNKTDTRIKEVIVQVGGLSTFNRSVAFPNFCFKMVLSSNHFSPATGVVVTATRSLDGAVFASCANAVAEIGFGWYKIDLATTDLAADVVCLRFTASGADDRDFLLTTT